jgi:hypothetical protein
MEPFTAARASARAGTACGEVCFNTSMTGYQEILTDPSYKAQIVAMTYPLIGNYGVNSPRRRVVAPACRGLSFANSPLSSATGGRMRSLTDYLQEQGVPGIQGIDTRALTRKLRVCGAMKGLISTEDLSESEAVEQARAVAGLDRRRLCEGSLTRQEPFAWDPEDQQSARFQSPAWPGRSGPAPGAGSIATGRHSDCRLRLWDQVQHPAALAPNGISASRSCRRILGRHRSPVQTSRAFSSPTDPETRRARLRGSSAIGDLLGPDCRCLASALATNCSARRSEARRSNSSSVIAAPISRSRTSRPAVSRSLRQNHGFSLDPDSLPGDVAGQPGELERRHRGGAAFEIQAGFCCAIPSGSLARAARLDPLFGEFRRLIETT